MINYDEDWFQYYEGELTEPPKLKVGNTLQTTTGTTGCGIITKVWDVPEKRKGMYADHDYNYMVMFLTDFGNEVSLSDVEVLREYRVTGIDTDIKGRLQYQIKQLTKIMEGL